MSTEVFASEYEAHYKLISVQEVDLHRWTAWCTGEGCRWSHTLYSKEQVRDTALRHCKTRHVRES